MDTGHFGEAQKFGVDAVLHRECPEFIDSFGETTDPAAGQRPHGG